MPSSISGLLAWLFSPALIGALVGCGSAPNESRRADVASDVSLAEANQPGSYAYVSGMTGITAVAMAGGFTYRARQSGMSVQRRGEDGRRSMGLASTVLPGDSLNIEERFF
ncbi:MAG: hypothetical protein R3F54_27420 [Alphaproteobacteria bacterium]